MLAFPIDLFFIEHKAPHGLVAEASDLGLAPGEWPRALLLLEKDAHGRLEAVLYKRNTPIRPPFERVVYLSATDPRPMALLND